MNNRFRIIFVDRRRGVGHNLNRLVVGEETRSLLAYGVVSFGWLLPLGANLNAQEFADLIVRHYSTENPKTAAIVAALRDL